MRDARRPLNEAKIISSALAVSARPLSSTGWSTKFDPGESMTDGIAIAVGPSADGRRRRLHVWDFGGQEIMHATHQFFLTHRSLYIVVLNGRQGREDADAEYWLNLIASFGGESPVIVVLNKIREHPFDVNRPALTQKFPMVRDVIATDCADPPEGLQALLAAVHREIDALPGLRDPFPAAWFALKDRLSAMPESYLTFDRYRTLAPSRRKDHEDQNNLAVVLHRLGVALNYREDIRLHDLHVLNPRWVTEGVYNILNHSLVAAQQGELSIRNLATILDPASYPPERHAFLLELMRKFELCFRFPDDDERYLIPQLLPKEQPEAADGFDAQACLCFDYITRPAARRSAAAIHRPHLRPERGRGALAQRRGPSLRGTSRAVVADPVERKVRSASRGRRPVAVACSP